MLVDMVTNKQTSPTPLFPAGASSSNTVLARMERIFRRAASLVLLAGLLTTAGMVELAREKMVLTNSLSLRTEGRMICHHNSYTMKDGFCYRYVVSSVTYSQATERCKREQHGAGMLYIDSASENR